MLRPTRSLTIRLLPVHIVVLSPSFLRTGTFLIRFCRRFFRARKYNVEEAYKMFNAVCLTREKHRHCVFYDNIDIESFEETRRIVRLFLPILQDHLNMCSSTLTGQAIGTNVASLCTTLTWKLSPLKAWPPIRKVPNPSLCQT